MCPCRVQEVLKYGWVRMRSKVWDMTIWHHQQLPFLMIYVSLESIFWALHMAMMPSCAIAIFIINDLEAFSQYSHGMFCKDGRWGSDGCTCTYYHDLPVMEIPAVYTLPPCPSGIQAASKDSESNLSPIRGKVGGAQNPIRIQVDSDLGPSWREIQALLGVYSECTWTPSGIWAEPELTYPGTIIFDLKLHPKGN